MKRTIARLASAIIDLTGELGTEAEGLADDPGIAGAEAVLYLRDAQRNLNQAREALRLAIANRGVDGKSVALFPE